MKNKQKLVLVIGSGRSGTSLVVGLLYRLGVDMIGNTDKINKLRLHNRLTRGYGEIYENRRLLETIKKEDLDGFKKFSKTRRDVWGWKGGDIIGKMSFIRRVYPKPYCIVCHRRDRKAQIKSVVKTFLDGDYNKAQKIKLDITNFEEKVEKYFKNYMLKKLDLYFEDFFTTPEKQIKRITDFLNIDYKPAEKKYIFPQLKHF